MFKTAGYAASLVAAGLFAMLPAMAQQQSQQDQQAHMQGQQQMTGQQERLSSSEKQAFKNAASSAMAQIEIARIAQQRSGNSDVKQLASDIQSNQSEVLGNLRSYGSQHKVEVPAQLSSKERQNINQLSNMSGDQFDRAFFNAIEKHERTQISALNNLQTTNKTQLQQAASTSLPIVRQQQSNVQQQMASMGIASSAAPLTDESQGQHKQKK